MEELKNLAIEKNTPEVKPSRKEGINLGKLTELRCSVDKLNSQIADNPPEDTYQANYDLIASLPDDKIIGFINNFNEQPVSGDEYFYPALIKVAEDKKLIRPQFDI